MPNYELDFFPLQASILKSVWINTEKSTTCGKPVNLKIILLSEIPVNNSEENLDQYFFKLSQDSMMSAAFALFSGFWNLGSD